MRLLILALDPEVVKAKIDELGLNNPYCVSDDDVVEMIGVSIIPWMPGYGDLIADRLSTISTNFKAKRDLVILCDMRIHSAVDKIPHDFSCLIYDGSHKRRLNYNTKYKTDIKINDINEIYRLTEILKTV
jgi:hypothetical protein